MIIWLASYPRSGNTLTRTILMRCFHAMNHTPPGDFDTGKASSDLWFAKTHKTRDVGPDDRVICIVRDGRAAMASYYRFLQDVTKETYYTLEQVVSARPPLQSWCEHVNWAFRRDPSITLLLRYEDLVAPGADLLERIGQFIGLPVRKAFVNDFASMQKKDPSFFRVGNNAPGIEEIEARYSALFWRANGDAMRLAGYSKSGNPVDA